MSTVSISAVVFDLDETICEFRRTSGEVLNLAFERIGLNLLFPVGEYHAIAERYMDDAEEKSERRALCFADLAEERDFDRSVGRDVAKTYNTIRDYGNVQFLPGVEATLDQLSGSYQLGLVTNGKPAMQDPKLAALDVTPEEAVYVGNSLESDIAGANRAGLSSVWVPYDHPGDSESNPPPIPDYRVDSVEALGPELWDQSSSSE